MNPRLAIAVSAALAFSLSTLSASQAGADDEKPLVDKIAAVVGSDIILLSEVNQRAKPQLAELEKAASSGGGSALMLSRRRRQVIGQALKEIIDDYLVRQQAVEMKVTVTTAEVEAAIANMARQNGIDLDTFEQVIVSRGQSMMSYRAEMRRNLLKYKVLNLRVRGRVNITEDEARQYYNNQVRDVRATGSFEGAHILVRIPPDARALEVSKLRKQAEEIKARVTGGEEFALVAKEVSQDQGTAEKGGSFGRLRPGELDPALDRAFLDMESGEVAGPVRTREGFHVLTLVSREDLGVQPFNEVKSRIINQLMQEEMVRQQEIWLKELRLQTFVDERI